MILHFKNITTVSSASVLPSFPQHEQFFFFAIKRKYLIVYKMNTILFVMLALASAIL